MGRRKTPALSENEKPLSFCLVYPLNFLFLSIKSVPIPLMWRDLHIACHGRRSWLVIFCWFWINSSLLEAYLAIYLPKVGRSIVWEDDQQRENRTPIWPFFLYWGSTSCQRKQWHPHSSTLAWQIPWTEEPGRLQSMESLRVGHDWATSLSLCTFMHWRRTWQPTPVFLPGESQGQGILVRCCLWGRTELDTTDATAAAAAAATFFMRFLCKLITTIIIALKRQQLQSSELLYISRNMIYISLIRNII